MKKTIFEQMQDRRKAVLEEAREICGRAVAFERPLTETENRKYGELIGEAEKIEERAKALREGEDRAHDLEKSFEAVTGVKPQVGSADRHALDAKFAEFGELLRNRTSGSVEVRALSTTIAGARTETWSANIGLRFVHQQIGIPEMHQDALTYQAPKWAALTAVAATSEGAAFPILVDPTLSTATLSRFGRYTLISDETLMFGSAEVGSRLADEVVNDVNTAVVNAVEAAAVAQGFATSAAQSLDTAIAKVRAATGVATGVLVNPADYFLFSVKTGADSGDDIASPVVAWNGVPLVPHDAVDAGFATVVSGNAFKLVGTALSLESLPELATGQVAARARMHAALSIGMAGNVAVKADIISP